MLFVHVFLHLPSGEANGCGSTNPLHPLRHRKKHVISEKTHVSLIAESEPANI